MVLGLPWDVITVNMVPRKSCPTLLQYPTVLPLTFDSLTRHNNRTRSPCLRGKLPTRNQRTQKSIRTEQTTDDPSPLSLIGPTLSSSLARLL